MSDKTDPTPIDPAGLPKAATGIRGLDEITGGGLPRGRPTLVCGGAGCGKTMLAAEFLVRGAVEHGEPGVFMMFEESADELVDIPSAEVMVGKTPLPPEGYEIDRVDVVVRLKRKS